MIALLFLAGAALWLTAVIVLSKRIPYWLGVTKHAKLTSVLLFPLILVLPVADELIGRWQFHRLCEREAVVNLSPEWANVKRARALPSRSSDLRGYLIPIRLYRYEAIDLDTGKVFFASTTFFASGGFLLGYLGLGLGTSTSSCHSPTIATVQKQVQLLELLKQGELK